ncbi:MAG TPA: hypothetical protein VG826_20015 [Pirellulales bacterium]|nr:hypothetical protein [Pirellulales bacterium]
MTTLATDPVTPPVFAATVVPPAPVLPLTGEGLPTAERVQEEIAFVLNKTLSDDLAHWANEYSKVGHRNMYLWKWCHQGVAVTTLSCVSPEYFDNVCDTKVMGVILDVLLDDIADRKGDDALLEALTSLSIDGPRPTFTGYPAAQRAYAEFTVAVWDEIVARARRYPLFDQYAKVLDYDYRQLFNVMRYSHLANEHIELLNLAEHDLYTPHNMHMIISSTLDLMCSPGFDRNEWGKVRDAAWHAQCMGRIGNLTTTWERELGDADYSSGVYASALNSGDLSVDDLRAGDHDKIRRAIVEGKHEIKFLRQWQEHRRYLLSQVPQVRSCDLARLVAGLERLICLHLGSRGYK